MKGILALSAAFATFAADAGPPTQAPRLGLRQTLQQYHSAGAPAPRQLSAIERAELRRQIAEMADTARPERRRQEDRPSNWKKKE